MRKLYRVAGALRRIGIVVLAITARHGLVCDTPYSFFVVLAPGFCGRNYEISNASSSVVPAPRSHPPLCA
jgi:hypothetical protein